MDREDTGVCGSYDREVRVAGSREHTDGFLVLIGLFPGRILTDGSVYDQWIYCWAVLIGIETSIRCSTDLKGKLNRSRLY